jgi:hypothetical protein
MNFKDLYENLIKESPMTIEDIYNEFQQATINATGDIAYDIDDNWDGEIESHYYAIAKRKGFDTVDFVADELYNDAYWVAVWGGDRLYDIVMEAYPKTPTKELRNKFEEVATELADIAKKKGHQSLHKALVHISGGKQVKRPKYKKPLTKSEKALRKLKKHKDALSKLPSAPTNIASEINKTSKLAKNGKIMKAKDGRSYTQIGGKWYQLSEALVEQLELCENVQSGIMISTYDHTPITYIQVTDEKSKKIVKSNEIDDRIAAAFARVKGGASKDNNYDAGRFKFDNDEDNERWQKYVKKAGLKYVKKENGYMKSDFPTTEQAIRYVIMLISNFK